MRGQQALECDPFTHAAEPRSSFDEHDDTLALRRDRARPPSHLRAGRQAPGARLRVRRLLDRRRSAAARGLRQALSRPRAGPGPPRAARGPVDRPDRHRGHPGRSSRDRDRGDASRQGRHDRQARLHQPGAARRAARRDRGERADLVGQLLGALRGARRDPRDRAGAGRANRARGAYDRARAAPAEPPPAPRLVLRPRALRRDPVRHRLASDRPVPGVHRRTGRGDRAQRSGQLRQPGRSRTRGLR